jgi:hypothetical protein
MRSLLLKMMMLAAVLALAGACASREQPALDLTPKCAALSEDVALAFQGPVFGEVQAPAIAATYEEQLDERDAYYLLLKRVVKNAGEIVPKMSEAIEAWWDEQRAEILVECGGLKEAGNG